MKRLTLLIMLCIAISTLGFSQSKDTVSVITDWPSLNEEQYAINYPSTWIVDTSGQLGTSFFLFSPKSSPSDDFTENVNLMIQDLSAYDFTFDQFVEASLQQVPAMITDGKIILSEREKKENHKYQRVIYTGTQGIFKLKFEQFCWVIDKKAYILTLTCEEDEYDHYQEIGASILNSFIIKP